MRVNVHEFRERTHLAFLITHSKIKFIQMFQITRHLPSVFSLTFTFLSLDFTDAHEFIDSFDANDGLELKSDTEAAIGVLVESNFRIL